MAYIVMAGVVMAMANEHAAARLAEDSCVVVANIVVAYIGMACVFTACIVMAMANEHAAVLHNCMVNIVMAHIVMDCAVMACIVMAMADEHVYDLLKDRFMCCNNSYAPIPKPALQRIC